MNTVQLKALALIILLLLMVAVYNLGPLIQGAPIGTGFTAKMLCSSVFVSGREEQDVFQHELQPTLDLGITATTNQQQKSATASIFGYIERTAVFRDGLGCTLLIDKDAEQLTAEAGSIGGDLQRIRSNSGSNPLQLASIKSPVDKNEIEKALNKAFKETNPETPRNTRAVVILHRGQIIGERYGGGFSASTPQLGWSMTKSVNSALIGILVKQGKLKIKDPAPVPEWQDPDDPRHLITTDQLLRMSSGLQFKEVYESDPASDVNVMLFAKADSAASAAIKPLAADPDTRWSYSSGTTNILSRIVRHSVDSDTAYWLFPHQALFAKIGAGQIFLEPDPSGTFVASSFMYATAQDWARLGLLYLQDGMWQGERVLPEGWVDYSRTPTPLEPVGRYGGQFWLNQGDQKWMPHLPEDLFAMSGHNGQFVFIIPSHDLVVVRLGYSPAVKATDLMAFVADLVAVLPRSS